VYRKVQKNIYEKKLYHFNLFNNFRLASEHEVLVKLIRKAIHIYCLFLTNLVISLMNLSPLGRRKEMGAAFLGLVIGARRKRISP
jgi:hypothetical protein